MSRHHYVTFLSPGTLFSEQTTKPISSWDIPTATRMAADIIERHGAKPYSFQFHTNIEADPVPDGEGGLLNVLPRRADESGMHFLGGEVFGYQRIKDRRDPKDEILLSNMCCNGWAFVVESTNGYKSVHPFEEEDVLVNASGSITLRGDDPVIMQYRRVFKEEIERLYERRDA